MDDRRIHSGRATHSHADRDMGPHIAARAGEHRRDVRKVSARRFPVAVTSSLSPTSKSPATTSSH